MKKVLNKISYAGISFAKTPHDRKCVLIINRMSIILTIMMFTFTFFAIGYKIYVLLFFTLPFFFAFAMAPRLNSLGWLKFSKFFFAFMPVICLTTVCMFNSIEAGDRFFFLTTITIPVLLFKQTWVIYSLSAFNLAAFMFADWYQRHHDPVLIFPQEIIAQYWYFSIISVFAVLFFVLRYFRGDSETYEKEMEEKNDLISEKNKEILDSIKYAKRIQQAHMPTDKHFETHLKRLKDKK